jgi:hypothetical protein
MHQRLLACDGLFAKGERVAVAVGSRCIANIALIVKATVDKLRSLGTEPYIITAMGSHGGATTEGQRELLDSLGITPEMMGVPVVYDTEWVNIGQISGGMPVYFSQRAMQDDAVVLINRVKRHTNFRGSVESGLVKMAVVGLGKHKGAMMIHSGGFEHFAENLIALYDVILNKAPIRLGIAIVENAYDETAFIEAIPAVRILDEEKRLLNLANHHVPRIPFNNIDVLAVREMGKDISGDGMDPNITGRFSSSIVPDYAATPRIARLVALDLTNNSHGSAVGMGYADFITRRLYEKIVPIISYTNAITATAPGAVKIPPVMPDDRRALEAAFRTCPNVTMGTLRLCIIRNTLELDEVYASEPLLADISEGANLEVDNKIYRMHFDQDGNMQVEERE